jgi:acyl-coenzyme A thioesterase PaaI-like protein
MSAGAAEPPDFTEKARALLEDKFAPWVQDLRLEIHSTGPIVLRLVRRAELCRIGGILCGQAIMAAADTAMVLAVAEALGEFVEMATVNMNSNFLAALTDEDALIGVEITKLGKTIAFGEARLTGAQSGKLCAQATLVYSLLRR